MVGGASYTPHIILFSGLELLDYIDCKVLNRSQYKSNNYVTRQSMLGGILKRAVMLGVKESVDLTTFVTRVNHAVVSKKLTLGSLSREDLYLIADIFTTIRSQM